MSVQVVEIEKMSKSFALGDGASLEILRSLDLTVVKGDTVAIMGPSGCGKSTLLNILGTLDTGDSGKVEIDGVSVDNKDTDFLADIRLNKIGFVFQKHHLLPQLTALENILLPTLKKPQLNLHTKALELLKKMGLESRQDHRPGQMSGGECQRVALCRALINSPCILLADEPTGALDAQSSEQLADLLIDLNQKENLTIILVTHSQRLAEKMNKTYRLENGSLEQA
jgi:lipoprotein-releasing system ATP-binding protein